MRRPRRTSRVISIGAASRPARSDGDHPPAVAQHLERLHEGLLAPERLERDVDAAAGQLEHRGDGIAVRSVDDVASRRALRAAASFSSLTSTATIWSAPSARANCTISEPTPAGRHDRDSLARPQLGGAPDGAEGRQRGAAEDRRLVERHSVR